jgi:hypothetical protein
MLTKNLYAGFKLRIVYSVIIIIIIIIIKGWHEKKEVIKVIECANEVCLLEVNYI